MAQSSTVLASDLERLILLASNPSAPNEERSSASAALDQFRTVAFGTSSSTTTAPTTPNPLARCCIDLLNSTSYEQVVFYCLTVWQQLLRKIDNKTVVDTDPTTTTTTTTTEDFSLRLELRQVILRRLLLFTATNDETTSQNTMPPYLCTKTGIVLALLLRADYPQRWPLAFDELIQMAMLASDSIQNSNSSTGNNDNCLFNPSVPFMRMEVFLRTLDAIVDEIVDGATGPHDLYVKDYMRGYDTNGQTIPGFETPATKIVNAILSMVVRTQQQRMDDKTSISFHSLTAMAMATLSRYASWIDLRLLANDQVVPILFSCLHGAGSGSDDDDDNNPATKLSVAASHCLYEMISRGMEDRAQKMHLILMNLNLFGRLLEQTSANGTKIDLKTVDVTHIDAVIAVAKLVDLAGQELLAGWNDFLVDIIKAKTTTASLESMTALASVLNQKMMPIFFQCFEYDDIDVSGAVIPLASSFLDILNDEMNYLGIGTGKDKSKNKNNLHHHHNHPSRSPQPLAFSVLQYLERILAVMFSQMQYPKDFQFDFEDEDEAEEELYRSELRKLFNKIVRIHPSYALKFLLSSLKGLPTPLSTAPTPHIEAALRLVYRYSETLRPPPGVKVALAEEQFCNIIVALHSSDVASHSHREVIMLYYDVAVRYSAILKDRPEFLPPLLNALSDSRGLQHPYPRVRSRSCYFLLKLTKAMGSTMRPFVETAISGILALLSNPSAYPIESDDSLYLFETVGLLLGKTNLPASEQQRYITAVMTPHVNSIRETLNLSDLQQDPDHYGPILAHSIAAIAATAFVGKGSSKPPTEVQAVLMETVSICLSVLQSLPSQVIVRDKCIKFLHRMVLCLGEAILPLMPQFLALFVIHCTAVDLEYVFQLLNQLCDKFKAKALSAIDAAILPILRKCHDLALSVTGEGGEGEEMTANTETNERIPPHLLTEQLSIRKLSFAFLQNVVDQKVTTVLLTPTNVGSVEDILKLMNDGATAILDPTVKRTCLLFFKGLVEQWAAVVVVATTTTIENGHSSSTSEQTTTTTTTNNNIIGLSPIIQTGFLRFIWEVFLPGMMISCIINVAFDERDAMQARNIHELGNILSLLKSKRGDVEFNTMVCDRILVLKNNCPADIVEAFRKAHDAKEMKSCLDAFLSRQKER